MTKTYKRSYKNNLTQKNIIHKNSRGGSIFKNIFKSKSTEYPIINYTDPTNKKLVQFIENETKNILLGKIDSKTFFNTYNIYPKLAEIFIDKKSDLMKIYPSHNLMYKLNNTNEIYYDNNVKNLHFVFDNKEYILNYTNPDIYDIENIKYETKKEASDE